MEVIAERPDYLWFLDYRLDEKVPDHSVLSKARARRGKEVFALSGWADLEAAARPSNWPNCGI